MKTSRLYSALLASAILYSGSSMAAFTLDFEGVGSGAAINNFYNGGTDSSGSSGVNYGVNFGAGSLGLIDYDAGGSGNFANEPTPNTIMYWLEPSSAVMNMAAGFTNGFSFFYTSSTSAWVNVWSGWDKTGNLLGSINLSAQNTDNCVGDPTGTFCNWTAAGVAFSGTAMSIDFGGTANYTGYDNITFGSSAPFTSVPEPETYAMLLVGLGLLGFTARRRKNLTA